MYKYLHILIEMSVDDGRHNTWVDQGPCLYSMDLQRKQRNDIYDNWVDQDPCLFSVNLQQKQKNDITIELIKARASTPWIYNKDVITHELIKARVSLPWIYNENNETI